MKQFIYTAFMLFLPCCLIAKSKKMPKPDWYPVPAAVYSPSEYLVTHECESAKNAEAAKNAAIDALSRYVSTQVQSSLKASLHSYQETAGGHTATLKETYDIERDILTSTDVKLYALETTDAYYDKATKSWYCAAFINRAKAFDMIRGEIDAARDNFVECYTNALHAESTDMFASLRQYAAAQAAGGVLLQKTLYAALFNSEAVRQEYGGDTKNAQGISAKVLSLKANNPLYLTVSGDVNNMVFAAVQEVLQDELFIVSDKSGCPYNVSVTVNKNIITEDKDENPDGGGRMVLYASMTSDVSLSIAPAGGGAAVYTFTVAGNSGKVASYTISRVEAKVCSACAEAVKNKMGSDFRSFMRGE